MNNGGDGFAQLRRWTVAVLLILLVFVTLAEVIDGLFLGDHLHTDAAFYLLVGGMISGLFVSATVDTLRRNGKNGNGK